MIVVYLICMLPLMNFNVYCEGSKSKTENTSGLLHDEKQLPKSIPTVYVSLQRVIIMCTNISVVQLSDSLENFLNCFASRWQQCLHVHEHEMTSHQMELETKFPCHLGQFHVSHIQTLQYKVQVLSHFQVRFPFTFSFMKDLFFSLYIEDFKKISRR